MNTLEQTHSGLKLFKAEAPILNECKHIPTKRIFDVFFSLTVLILGLPIYLIVYLLVKMTSKGPAIYFQERIGRGGHTFPCYKFRTMYKDADERLKEILKHNPQLKREWDQSRKLKNDPRITAVGRFLRRTSLDELPQFWNVLIGDLSVVGPRPVVKEEIEKHFKEKAVKIFSVRPGITGMWQISGRSNTTYEERIRLDELYVEKRSIALDIKIIALTIPCMITRSGAY